MFSLNEIMQLLGSLIWLLAGVGVFIVGMKINVTQTCLLLPFTKHLVRYSCRVIKDKNKSAQHLHSNLWTTDFSLPRQLLYDTG